MKPICPMIPASILVLALLTSAPAAAGGDPAVWREGDDVSIAAFPGLVARDFTALFSTRSLPLLGAGAIGFAAVREVEDPSDQREFLTRGAIDPFCDAGNIYGGPLFAVPLAVGMWGVGAACEDGRMAMAGRDAAEVLLLVTGVTGGLKLAVDRERPNGKRYSFPSGHTATAFGLAPILHRHFGGGVGAAAYAMALLTAGGRMEDSYHHGSDVIAGAALGYLIGRTIAGRSAPRALGGEFDIAYGRIGLTFRR